MSVAMLERLGHLFYIVNPRKTRFRDLGEVPDYVRDAMPLFIVFIVVEQLVELRKGAKPRLNDSLASISQGILMQIAKFSFRGAQTAAYLWIYHNLRIFSLPWDSYVTWFLALVGCDLGYYCLHRASHEINVLWGAHQVHHSSEEYNLTTALRESVLQPFVTWMFYLPLALIGVPPSMFLVHAQFNLLYKFWVHTKHIRSLGPLELVLNTPSHHRVHHGRNRYCIDKNFGGVFIIWDRLFGTFAPESEEVVYGLTHPLETFSPFRVQLCHYFHMWQTFWKTQGLGNKLSVIFKGPGWDPGKPWRGNVEDIPDVHAPVEPYNPALPIWCDVYLFSSFMTTTVIFLFAANLHAQVKIVSALIIFFFVIFSTFTMGEMFDCKPLGFYLEMAKCLAYLPLEYLVLSQEPQWFYGSAMYVLYVLRTVHLASFLFWVIFIRVSIKTKSA